MSYIRQEWPVDEGRIVLFLGTDGPASAEQVEHFGKVVAAVEASGLVASTAGTDGREGTESE